MKPRLFIASAIVALIVALPVSHIVADYKAEIKKRDEKIQQIQRENVELHKQLQTKLSIKAKIAQAVSAKAAEPAPTPAPAPVVAPPPVVVAPVVQPSSPDQDKAFIYAKESGNNPAAINHYSGACGLGQALPCSKMPCTLTDYACQDQFFTGYMLNRYGSWANAKAFWLTNRWW